jgi:hypothetical protein
MPADPKPCSASDTLDPDLTAIEAALADISDTELAALIAATYGVPQTAPGLLAWIDSACEGELNRRRDFDYPLLPLVAAIDPSEDEVSISAATAMRVTFAEDSRTVASFLNSRNRGILALRSCRTTTGPWRSP